MSQPLSDKFRQPPRIFSPVPTWWWSGEPIVKERLRWQMEKLAEAGVFNLLIMNLAPNGPFFGSKPDEPSFLSEDWWDCFFFVLQHAEQLGMFVWFYDQLGFSGTRLQDKLLFANPEFRGAAVRWVEENVKGGSVAAISPPLGVYPLAVHAISLDDDRPPKCLAVFYEGAPLPFQWKAAPGNWKVVLFYAIPSKFDYLNPKACQVLFDKIHGEFERRASKYLGKVLVGSFQDELPMLPRWTWGFPEEFRKRKGYEIREWLPALFFPTNEEGRKVRCDALEVLTGLAEEAFFKPLFDWHERHGMICGYDQMNRNADPIEGQRWYLDYFRTMRWFSAPGQDHSGDSKPHDAISQLYKRKRVWLEGFHSSGWGHNLDELSQWLHFWFQRGSNLYNPHAVYYSTKGSWWEWAPPSTCWRQPYWRHYRIFAEHVSRLSLVLSEGKHVCPLAVLYPTTTIQAHMGLGEPEEVARLCQRIYWDLVGNPNWWQPKLGILDKDFRDFTILDEDSVAQGKVQRGALVVGNYRIRTVLMPSVAVLKAKTFDRLFALAKSGGTVIAVGCVPEQIIGKSDEETATAVKALFGTNVSDAQSVRSEVTFPSGGSGIFVKEANGVTDILAAKLARDVEGVPYRRFRIDREDFFFVIHPKVFVNPKPVEGAKLEPEIVKAKFAAKGVPHLWDTLTGEVKPLPAISSDSGTEVLLDFSRSSGLVISFRRGKPTQPEVFDEEVVSQLEGLWDISYIPTIDNRWCDFDLPASETLPIQIRKFKFKAESEDEDGLEMGWHLPEFDDSNWEQRIYSFGTYLLKRGPFKPDQAPSVRVSGNEPDWQPVQFSLKLGIENDPIHMTTLGPKGHVPVEFVDLGAGDEGEVFDLFTKVVSSVSRNFWLCVGGNCGKEVWLNGNKVLDYTDANIILVPVRLNAGQNILLLRVNRQFGRMRTFFQFHDEPSRTVKPIWIWFPELPYPDFSIPSCWRAFRRNIFVPEQIQSAWVGVVAESGYRLWVNGHFLGEGRIDRQKVAIQRYEIGTYLQQGKNTIAIRAWTEGGPAGLLVYGEIVLRGGSKLIFSSDQSWRSGAWELGKEPSNWMERDYDDGSWARAQVQGFPPMAPWGEVEGLLENYAPHPLPRAGWLDGKLDRPFEPIFEPFPERKKRVCWLRFKIPTGAQKMRMNVKGKVRVFVDGKEVFPDANGAYFLPSPEKEKRIAAIRVETELGYPEAGAILEPLNFEVSKGKMGLGAWADWGLSCYSGAIAYEKTFTVNSSEGEWWLDLGKVRGSAEVWLNGEKVGVRIWSPFKFNLTGKIRNGENHLQVIVYSSLGPHYSEAVPTPYLFGEQKLAGLFGPVRLLRRLKG
ncbi:MAG: hypothetical protein N3B10_08515 [Armatimonadetes bacterium]|nr:hypothetical protein [Armatimonadota bacterium]